MIHHTPPAQVSLVVSLTEVETLSFALTKTIQLTRAAMQVFDTQKGAARYADRIERIRRVERVLRDPERYAYRLELDVGQVETAMYCLSRARGFLAYANRGKRGKDEAKVSRQIVMIDELARRIIDEEAANERVFLMGGVI